MARTTSYWKGGQVSISFDDKDFKEAELKLQAMIKVAAPKVSLAVAQDVHDRIQKSGNVPKDTGALMGADHVLNDKFDRNFAIIGWTTPYARVRYFGVGQEREQIKDPLTGKKETYILGIHGIPFWDRPITGNTQLLISLYEKYAAKEFK